VRDVEGITLTVKDNGKGCDLSLGRNGVGLQNINTRASLHKGKVSLKSSIGNGFELMVFFPVEFPE
jgi:signal transduction histidine kinase